MDTPITTPATSAKKLYVVPPDAKPEALVMHCSDPRFQAAFQQFIEHELGLPKGRYVPLVINGGAGVLSYAEHLPKEFKFIKERIEYCRERFPSVKRVILINHEDCRYYQSLKQRVLHLLGLRLSTVVNHAREDLGLLTRVFDRLLSHLGYRMEFYYARFADAEKTKVNFEKLGG